MDAYSQPAAPLPAIVSDDPLSRLTPSAPLVRLIGPAMSIV
jgi:hypothetical protein